MAKLLERSLGVFRNKNDSHTAEVRGVALALELGIIITASEDTTARVWSSRSGRWKCVQCLSEHTKGLKSVVIAEGGYENGADTDSVLVATASGDGTCILWSSIAGAQEPNFKKRQVLEMGGAPYPCCLAFAPYTAFLVVGTTQGMINFNEDGSCGCAAQIWERNPQSEAQHSDRLWQLTQTLTSKSGQPVRSVTVSPGSTLVITGSSDGKARVYTPVRVESSGVRKSVRGSYNRSSNVLLPKLEEVEVLMHPGGGMVRPSVTPSQIPAHSLFSVTAVCVSSDDEMFATAGNDCNVRIYVREEVDRAGYTARVFQFRQTLGVTAKVKHGTSNYHRAHSDGVLSAVFAPGTTIEHKTFIVTASKDKTVVIWMWDSDEKEWAFTHCLRHTGWVWQVGVVLGDFEPGAPLTESETECTVACGLGEHKYPGDQSATIWRVSLDKTANKPYMRTHIRPATNLELLFPLAITVISFFQSLCFVFDEGSKWNDRAVAPPRAIGTIVMPFSLGEALLKMLHEIDVIWYFLATEAVSLMLVFVMVYGSATGRFSILVKLITTVGVLPIWMHIVSAFDCYENKLEAATEIQCWEGVHVPIAGTMALAGLTYLYLLLPFTAANGDVNVCPPAIWFRPQEWVRRRRDMDTGVDLGALNRSSDPNVSLSYAYSGLFFKLAISTARRLSTYHPHRKVILSLGASMLPVVVALWCGQPMSDVLMNRLLWDSSLTTTLGFACATFSVYLNDRSSLIPALCFYGMFLVLCIRLFLWIRREVKNRSEPTPWNQSDIIGRFVLLCSQGRSMSIEMGNYEKIDAERDFMQADLHQTLPD